MLCHPDPPEKKAPTEIMDLDDVSMSDSPKREKPGKQDTSKSRTEFIIVTHLYVDMDCCVDKLTISPLETSEVNLDGL